MLPQEPLEEPGIVALKVPVQAGALPEVLSAPVGGFPEECGWMSHSTLRREKEIGPFCLLCKTDLFLILRNPF